MGIIFSLNERKPHKGNEPIGDERYRNQFQRPLRANKYLKILSFFVVSLPALKLLPIKRRECLLLVDVITKNGSFSICLSGNQFVKIINLFLLLN